MDVKNYATNNPEKLKANRKQHYINNREKYKRMSILYNATHPDQRSKSFIARTQARREAIPLWYETVKVKELYHKRDELSKLWGHPTPR